ncbi:ABC transporter permease [Streptomyces cinnamoneus]|uniref:ABC transporter permease n=1 Tax=Streptomyces cinnamoneus TaxID=53446 RepID=UPI003423225D
MAGPVLIAAGLSAMLLCGNAVSREVESRPAQAQTQAYVPVENRAQQDGADGHARVQAGPGSRAERQQDRNAVGMRILMTPLIAFSGIGILNTLLLATRRRRQEFAVLRLTGSTRGQMLRMLGWESVVVVLSGLSAAAAVVGVSLGGLSTRLDLPPAELTDLLPWGQLAQVGAGCAGLGLLGVVVPGLLVMRVRPSQTARDAS